MPEPKKYRSVYTDREHRMYSNDPMRQRIAAKYDEPVIPIEEVVVTPKYRTLPQNRFFRRPGETEQQYYSRMAVQESITPAFPEKDIIAAQLVGGLASKIAPRLGAMSQAEQQELKELVKEMKRKGLDPSNPKNWMPEVKKVSAPKTKTKDAVLDEIKFWWQQLGRTMEGRDVGGSPMFLAVRDEEGNLPLGTTNMAKAFNSLTSKGNAPQP